VRHTSTNGDDASALKRVLRAVVPGSLVRNRGIYLRLGPKPGRIYARLRILDTLGMRGDNMGTVAPDARSFVFVCFGNIMRSPMAQLIFEQAARDNGLSGLSVTSAGIHATEGKEAHPRARVGARALGLSLDHHRSRLLNAETVSQADAIFAMDFQNKAELLACYPEAGKKIFMLSAYAEGSQRYREIPDPYYGDQEETFRCYAVLNTCVQNLVRSLLLAAPGRVPNEAAVR